MPVTLPKQQDLINILEIYLKEFKLLSTPNYQKYPEPPIGCIIRFNDKHNKTFHALRREQAWFIMGWQNVYTWNRLLELKHPDSEIEYVVQWDKL